MAGLAGAQSEPTVDVSLTESEIEGGATTEVELTLSNVPADGTSGITVDLTLDGSVARFTGSGRWESEWPQTMVDTADDPASAWVVVNQAGNGGVEAGATDVNLGFAEVVGVGAGETEIDATVSSFQAGTSEAREYDASAGSAALTVTGDASESELSEYFGDGSDDGGAGGDGGSGGNGDGTAGGDGGSSGSEGGDGSGASSDGSDGGSGDGGTGSDGSGDGTDSDGSGGDGQPGFGVGAALAALAAGVGARLRGRDDGDGAA